MYWLLRTWSSCAASQVVAGAVSQERIISSFRLRKSLAMFESSVFRAVDPVSRISSVADNSFTEKSMTCSMLEASLKAAIASMDQTFSMDSGTRVVLRSADIAKIEYVESVKSYLMRRPKDDEVGKTRVAQPHRRPERSK